MFTIIFLFLTQFLGASELPLDCTDDEAKKKYLGETYLINEGYKKPSIYTFAKIHQTEQSYRVRFSVKSGFYPNGFAFSNPGKCLAQYSIDDQCVVKIEVRDGLTKHGVEELPPECYEDSHED